MATILSGLVVAMAVVVSARTSTTVVQERRNLSGTWTLDRARSGPIVDVWGQQRPRQFVIVQTPFECSVDTGDSSIVGIAGPLVFKLDGTATTILDRSLGDLPGFTRKIRTEAAWERDTLVTRTTHFAEKLDTSGRPELVRGAITRILRFSLTSDGNTLVVERTGHRELPPEKLHGRPYQQEDDLVYGKDTAVYARVAQNPRQ